MPKRSTRTTARSRNRSNRNSTRSNSRRASSERNRASNRSKQSRTPERDIPQRDNRGRRRAPENAASGRNQALEGLRAIAIIAIVLYHLSVSWLPSGHMGVVLFLVLSGYLVTCSILKSIRSGGLLSVPRQWLRRVVRIWPSTALMIVVTVALCVVFNHVLLTKLKPDLVPSLLLANNLGAILRGASYFDKLGGVSPLTHLWYLGVDLQFFVGWSVILYFLCPEGRPNRMGRLGALALAVVSAILMAILFDPNGDPTRVYYGPDTRAFSPLLGAWLALAWPLGGRPQRLDANHHTVQSIPLTLAAPLGLVGMVVVMALVPDTSAFLYRGGMLLVSLFSVLLIAGCLETDSPLSRVLSLPPLTWIGTRSFGIYLWHFPLFQLFKVTQSATSPVLVVLAIALSVLMAEVSLRFVDQVIAQGRIPFMPRAASGRRGTTPNQLAWAPACALALIVAAGTTGLLVIPDETAVPEDAIKSTGAGAATAVDLSNRDEAAKASPGSKDKDSGKKNSSSKSSSSKSSSTSASDVDEDEPIVLRASEDSVSDGLYTPLIVADSIAGDAEWCFLERIPDGFLDSYVGRMPSQAAEVLGQYIDQGVVGDIVIVASFSNMPPSESDLESILKKCGDRTLYLVNARIPEVEEEEINQNLEDFVESHKGVKLIDWNSLSDSHDSWFYDDATHLTEKGQEEYVNLITHSIAEDFEKDGGSVLTEDEAEDSDSKAAGGSKVVDPTA